MQYVRRTYSQIICGIMATVVLVAMTACAARADWPQWGGPERDFTVHTSGLAEVWPESGPRRLWERELGDGYSSVVAENGVLYTMYREGEMYDAEYTIAMDAKTGKTIWEQKHASPVPEGGQRYPGPNTTPLLAGDQLYAIGRNAVVYCYDKKDGKVRWTHDLVAELGAVVPGWGYSSSPILYKNTVIAAVGTEPYHDGEASEQEESTGAGEQTPARKNSLIAFERISGAVAWKSQDFKFRFSSPIVIRHGGKDQLIVLPQEKIVSIDPKDGALLWGHDLEDEEWHMTTPLWNGEDLLFSGSGHTGRVIQLTGGGGKTVPRELWASKKVGLGIGTPVRLGNLVVAPKGGRSSLLVGVDLRTGERKWVQRGFGQATLVYGDGKIILLDEQGRLALASATLDGLTLHSQWQVPEWSGQTFTAPTLVDRVLYVRDRQRLMAFDLG
ncbi:MAG: PQQ-binding-like beta-propeller repeat protein [Phycisphaerales bacterium]|nr:MAG: PQQ-binding-like beta-propeller repeat protein [Phycisphaerales bacterium]